MYKEYLEPAVSGDKKEQRNVSSYRCFTVQMDENETSYSKRDPTKNAYLIIRRNSANTGDSYWSPSLAITTADGLIAIKPATPGEQTFKPNSTHSISPIMRTHFFYFDLLLNLLLL